MFGSVHLQEHFIYMSVSLLPRSERKWSLSPWQQMVVGVKIKKKRWKSGGRRTEERLELVLIATNRSKKYSSAPSRRTNGGSRRKPGWIKRSTSAGAYGRRIIWPELQRRKCSGHLSSGTVEILWDKLKHSTSYLNKSDSIHGAEIGPCECINWCIKGTVHPKNESEVIFAVQETFSGAAKQNCSILLNNWNRRGRQVSEHP